MTDGFRAALVRTFAGHLENMPELDTRVGVLKCLKLTIDVKDGAPIKYIIIPEWHLGPAVPTPLPPADPSIVKHQGGRPVR